MTEKTYIAKATATKTTAVRMFFVLVFNILPEIKKLHVEPT
ncbi:MAG: hypothetical protein ACU84J_03295 [Gammaproteobacteria bacterium]